MNAHRILIVSENSHLSLALELALRERGHDVRCEADSMEAVGTIREFSPDFLLTACEETVFVGKRGAEEIAELPRPVDTGALFRLLAD